MSFSVPVAFDFDAASGLRSLGPRLARVAMNVREGERVVDVGTDHARLLISLVRSGRVPTAIGVELRDGPLARARMAIAGAALLHLIVVREGHGLNPVEPHEVEVGVLAGFGARTAIEVVTNATRRGVVLPRLLIQVNRDIPSLRGALGPAGYTIHHEELVYDDGRAFVIIVAEPGTEQLEEVDRWLGPKLRARRSDLFVAVLRTRHEHLSKLAEKGPLAVKSATELAIIEAELS